MRLLLVSVLAAVLAAPAAVAEEPPAEPRFGLGVDPVEITSMAIATALATAVGNSQEARRASTSSRTVYVPVNLLPSLRLEPSLAHLTFDSTASSGASSSSESVAVNNAALAVAYRFAGAGPARFFAGARVGVGFVESERKASGPNTPGETTQTTQWLWSATALAGAEYFFARELSLGVDVEAGYRHAGAPNTRTGTPLPPGSTSSSTLGSTFTLAGLRLRFYF